MIGNSNEALSFNRYLNKKAICQGNYTYSCTRSQIGSAIKWDNTLILKINYQFS
ncbi:Uncharacterised protein [Salmonella enterica subsp. arizonae]|uniref:Uncharacterized protein n=1 Tax=Salmonella enterica subsp. arizonae TaxID=59203 RepID=A0A379TMU9_SALER|nr:Uncharacterised protein [Salmonella enterica subsp. arizonae]SUG51962.1 Uncharacterised protein [Salmonella enterica subsp. arizonae]